MSKVTVNDSKRIRAMLPVNAVNNGPAITGTTQIRSNAKEYAALEIPFSRIHDANFNSNYGGPHIVDIHVVFPDFDADINDPASYDFALTDRYLKHLQDCGSEVFYRLGASIEHAPVKYGTKKPKDFDRWAEICEHIIAHYTEGWANGYTWQIRYWEIWNEPDMCDDDSPLESRPTWGGTAKEFYEFYRTVSIRLKKRFPHLKIGGPALCYRRDTWTDHFLEALSEGERAPLDFFSWHLYTTDPHEVSQYTKYLREKLNRYGYPDCELNCNEWNYVRNWTDQFVYSVETIIGEKGAAFVAACMCEGQNAASDMMMYYDVRPCTFCGMFDFYTLRPLKTYYVFEAFRDLRRCKTQVESLSDDRDIYTVSAADDNHAVTVICYYSENDGAPAKTVTVEGLRKGVTARLLDREHTMDVVDFDGEITLQPNSVLVLNS